MFVQNSIIHILSALHQQETPELKENYTRLIWSLEG